MKKKSRPVPTRLSEQTESDRRRNRPPRTKRLKVTALLAVLAVALFTVAMSRAGRQRVAVERIWSLGGYVERESDREDLVHKSPRWYRTLFGDDFLNALISVRLSETDISNDDLSWVGKFAHLEFLDLTDTQITDKGIAHLSSLQHLEVLALNNTLISDAGLANLLPCAQLQALNLEETKVTDVGLATLCNLGNLEWLNLSGTAITDAGLRHLATCPQLNVLVLDGCDVSPEAVSELSAALPELDVYDSNYRRPFWPFQ